MSIGSTQVLESQRRAPQGPGRFLVLAVLVSLVAHAGLAVALMQDRQQTPQLRPIMSVELVSDLPGSRTEERVDGRSAGRATPTKAAKGSSASVAATKPAKVQKKLPVKVQPKPPAKVQTKSPVRRPEKAPAKTPVKIATKAPAKSMAEAADSPPRKEVTRQTRLKPIETAAQKQHAASKPAKSMKSTQIAAIPPAAGQDAARPLPQKTLAIKMRKPAALPAAVTAKFRKPDQSAISRKTPRKQLALAAPTKPIMKRKTAQKSKKPTAKKPVARKTITRKPAVRKPAVQKPVARKAIRTSRHMRATTKARIRKASLNSKRLTRQARPSRNAQSQSRSQSPSQARSGAYAPPRAGRQGGINPIPHYPRIARKNGWQGRVLLAVSVGRNGRATSVRVRRSSGHAVLDQAAMTTVRRWRFTPARRGAVTVAGMAVVPITFRLTR